MSKNRKAVTCNGRPAFYAAMYEDIRQCAMDKGWAVALHGSLASDMDIMAMPWTEKAEPFSSLVDAISKLFTSNDLTDFYTIAYNEKPYNRVVATIPIWEDFYLDISTISYNCGKCEAVTNLNAKLFDWEFRGGWIPVSEHLPKNEEEVEISCIRRYIGAGDREKKCHLTARAFYTDGTMTTEDSCFMWDDCDDWEYDEEKDAYIIPEGWWEYVTFSEQFGVVDAEVAAWRPISEPYKEESGVITDEQKRT